MQTYVELFNSYTPEKQAQIRAAFEALKAQAAAAKQQTAQQQAAQQPKG